MQAGGTMESVEQGVAEIEAASAAEVVVCFHNAAASYRDLDLVWSFVFGVGVLAFKVWSPYAFHADWVLANVVFCALLGFVLSKHVKPMKRLFLSSKRAEQECLSAARAEFTRLGVSHTKERTGMLVFVSRFERRLLLVPDLGLQEKVAPTVWEEWTKRFGVAESDEALLKHLKEQLAALRGPLSRQLPRRSDDTNELPDRPVEVS
jgi:putative membrane protein